MRRPERGIVRPLFECPRLQRILANTWLAWARLLAARRTEQWLDHHSPGRTFFRPSPPRFWLERWMIWARQVFNRTQYLVQPLLRERCITTLMDSRVAASKIPASQHLPTGTADPMPSLLRVKADAGSPATPGRSRRERRERSGTEVSQLQPVEIAPDYRRLSRQRHLRTAGWPEELLQVRARQLGGRERLEQLVDRVSRRCRRIESTFIENETRIFRRDPPPPPRPSVASSQEIDVVQPRASQPRRAGTRVEVESGGPGAWNLEVLTDRVVEQIDGRMRAWQERMGRI